MSDIGTTATSGFDFSPAKIVEFIRKSDLGLAIGIMAILVVLILPLPTLLLDVALAFSLSFSILILMTAVFIRKPLEFSSFPTVLLITTMLRLALNLASTRLILGHGNEGTAASGYVIQAFGKLIMQGNFVIGLIVFAILIIVNFVVITKGSGRIAEVAARFSLDAMPGKQMAIDADLSAGLIDEKEAKLRRKTIEAESNFFGAMAVTRAALPLFRAQRFGAIVNISSMGGQMSFPGFSAYSASKFALEGASEALAQEMAPFGVKVLIVEPGAFRTELVGSAMREMPQIAAYADVVGPTRAFAHDMHQTQAGDPAKAAAAIEAAIEAKDTPLRLVLGSDAVDAIRAHAQRLLAELAGWEETARATAFDG